MQKKYANLTELHKDRDHVILTAHRGASADCPDNTLPAFERAVAAGCDLIEFDLRASSEGIPLVLHDATLDRTTDGHGEPEKLPLAEIRKLNASYAVGPERFGEPQAEGVTVPTFEEVLAAFAKRTMMNIQIYARTEAVLREICRLYREYGMYDRGYLSINSREQFDFVRRLDPEIEICFLPGWDTRTEPEALKLCRSLGCRFVQPVREFLRPDTVPLCRGLGLRENVFFSDDPAQARGLVESGVRGFLTNRILTIGRFDPYLSKQA